MTCAMIEEAFDVLRDMYLTVPGLTLEQVDCYHEVACDIGPDMAISMVAYRQAQMREAGRLLVDGEERECEGGKHLALLSPRLRSDAGQDGTEAEAEVLQVLGPEEARIVDLWPGMVAQEPGLWGETRSWWISLGVAGVVAFCCAFAVAVLGAQR